MERRIFVRNSFVVLVAIGLAACEHEYRDRPYERRRYGPPPHPPPTRHGDDNSMVIMVVCRRF